MLHRAVRAVALGVLAVTPTLVITQSDIAQVDAGLTPGCVVDTTGTIGFWRGEGTSAATVGPDLVGPVTNVAAEVGQGFSFDGTGIVTAPGIAAPTTAVSVEAWVRPAPVGPFGHSQALFTRWDTPGNDDSARAYALLIDPYGNLQWATDETGAQRPIELFAAAPQLFDGLFHHVAATWDQTAMSLYVDGVAIGTRASQRGTLNPAPQVPLRLGSQAGLGDPFWFTGVIDEPSVWNRALGADEVAAIAGAGIAGKCVFAPVQTAVLVGTNTASNDRLGSSVAVDGSTLVSGAPFSSLRTQFSGAVTVFTRVAGGWTAQATVTPSDPALVDFFGWSVDISGDTMVVGSQGNNGGGTDSGAAYVFTRVGSTWTQQAKLLPSDTAALDQFGFSVAIEGDTIVVGSPFDDGTTADSGSAYIFTRSGTIWTEQARLSGPGELASDNFGRSVGLTAGSIVIGSPGDDDAGVNAGTAYVFTSGVGGWTLQQQISAADASTGDLFGQSVAINLDTVAVGAPLDDDNGTDSGSAYVFARTAGAWSQTTKLLAADGTAGDSLGNSVATDGTFIVAGAYLDTPAGLQSGSAYVFARTGAAWPQLTKLIAADGAIGDGFGYSVATAGVVIVGAYLDDQRGGNSGSAYVFMS